MSRHGLKLICLGALVTLSGCDSGYWQYGETNKHHAERMDCEAENRVNQKVANELAYEGRSQEADIYVRTHPIQSCPEKP
jgi:hypothetical protein